MKNIFYSLILLIAFSSQAQSFNYHTNYTDTNLSQKVFSITTDYLTNIIFNANNNEVEEEDEAFDFDIKKYLLANFNAFAGLFDAYEVAVEEDEAFDFDIAAYLPVGFNANATYLSDISEIAIVEDDETFEFDTAVYLPVGFNASVTYLSDISEIDIIEEDEAFEFNIAAYLPVGFNAKQLYLADIEEIELEEADEAFDFNTKDYLPNNFNAHENKNHAKEMNYLSCIAFPSI